MKKAFQWILVLSAFLLICILVILGVQRLLFFHPHHNEEAYAYLQRQDGYEEISVPHKDGQLRGWIRYDEEREIAPLLLFFGGNGQNSSYTFRVFENNNTFSYFEGYHVLFMDYPGYGLSDGTPSEKSLFSAALAVFDYAKALERADSEQVVVLGYSIGTGVASYVCSRREVAGLILAAPFDEGLSLYNHTLNVFHGPLKLLAKYKFDSLSYAKEISVAPLILASRDDEVIPCELALNLSEHFPKVENTILLDGVSHDGFFFSFEVLSAIKEHLQTLSPSES